MRNPCTLDVIFQTRTTLGVCVRETEAGPDIWLPLSRVEIAPKPGSALIPGAPIARGQVVELTAPERLLIEKGML